MGDNVELITGWVILVDNGDIKWRNTHLERVAAPPGVGEDVDRRERDVGNWGIFGIVGDDGDGVGLGVKLQSPNRHSARPIEDINSVTTGLSDRPINQEEVAAVERGRHRVVEYGQNRRIVDIERFDQCERQGEVSLDPSLPGQFVLDGLEVEHRDGARFM